MSFEMGITHLKRLFCYRKECMQVKYFAYIRDYTKTKECDEVYKETIKELLHHLSEKYGEKFRNKALKNDGKELGDEIIILVNGRHVAHLGGIDTKLKPNDIVQIFPVVAGG